MVKKQAVLEKLLNIIPGFHGYRKKEYIREDDRLIREYLARLLDDAIRDLGDALSSLAEYDFATAERFDNVMRDMRIIADKIRWAEHGYQPHYNIVKIQEEDLEKMKEVDATLVEEVGKIRSIVEGIRKDAEMGNPVRDKIPVLSGEIGKVRQILLEREKIIHGWTS
jgi:hypothetical protein